MTTASTITNEAVEKAARAMYADVEVGEWELGELETLLAYRRAARIALEAAPQPVVDREALEKLAARYEDLAGPEREFDEHSIHSLREEARTGAYRLAARELRALLNGGAK